MNRSAQIDIRRSVALIVIVLAFLAGAWSGHATAIHIDRIDRQPQIASEIDRRGDVDGTAGEGQADLGDGILMEDEPGWDCHTMGNLICGPGQG